MTTMAKMKIVTIMKNISSTTILKVINIYLILTNLFLPTHLTSCFVDSQCPNSQACTICISSTCCLHFIGMGISDRSREGDKKFEHDQKNKCINVMCNRGHPGAPNVPNFRQILLECEWWISTDRFQAAHKTTRPPSDLDIEAPTGHLSNICLSTSTLARCWANLNVSGILAGLPYCSPPFKVTESGLVVIVCPVLR